MFNWKRVLLILCVVQVITSATFYSVTVAGSSEESALSLVALTFVEKVAKINLDAYNVTYDCKGPMSSFLYLGHTEALINIGLTGPSGQLEIDIQFIDNCFVSYRLKSRGSTPVLSTNNETLNVFDTVNETLEQYRLVFNAPYCSQLAVTIDEVTTPHQGQTIETDCAILKFIPNASLGRSVAFVWYYKGALRKKVGVEINKEKGFLELFKDSWGLTKISDAEISVSKEAAVEMAINRAQKYIDEMGAAVADIDVELRYINSYPEARGGDCFVLYPTWTVKFIFDKCFADDVNGHWVDGYFVGIWADTGNVRTAIPQGYFGQPPLNSNKISDTLTITVIAVPLFVVFGAIILTIRTRKKSRKPN